MKKERGKGTAGGLSPDQHSVSVGGRRGGSGEREAWEIARAREAEAGGVCGVRASCRCVGVTVKTAQAGPLLQKTAKGLRKVKERREVRAGARVCARARARKHTHDATRREVRVRGTAGAPVGSGWGGVGIREWSGNQRSEG